MLGMFTEAAIKHQVPVNVLMAMAEAESGFDVYSTSRGKGLMQFTDADAELFGIDPFDPKQSIDVAAKILANRIGSEVPIDEAVIEFHAGKDRESWNDAAKKYGATVIHRAKEFASLFPEPPTPEPEAQVKRYQEIVATEGPITWDQYKMGMKSIEQSYKSLKPPSTESLKAIKQSEQSLIQLREQIEQQQRLIEEKGADPDSLATLRAQTLIYERRRQLLVNDLNRYNQDIENYNGALEQLKEAEKIIKSKEQIDLDATFIEEFRDTIAAWGTGSAALLDIGSSIFGLFSGDMENWGTQNAEMISDYYSGMKSDAWKQANTIKQNRIDAQEGQFDKFKTALYETIKSPELLSSFIVEQLPMLTATGGAGVIAGRFAQVAGATPKLVSLSNVGTQVLTGALMQGGDVGGDVYQQIMTLNDLQVKMAANKAYQALINDGVDPDVAERQVALELSRLAAIKSGALSLGLQGLIPSARTIEKSFAGIKDDAITPLQGALRGGLAEGLTESTEEGTGGYFTNVAVQQVDPERGLYEDVGQRTAEGLLAGPFGAVAGGMNAQQQRQAQADYSYEIPPNGFDFGVDIPKELNGGGGGQARPEGEAQQGRKTQQAQQAQQEPQTDPKYGMAQGDIVNLQAAGDTLDVMFEGIDQDGNYIFRAIDGMQYQIDTASIDAGYVVINKLGDDDEGRGEQPSSSAEVATQDGPMQQEGVPTPEGGDIPQQSGSVGDGSGTEGAGPVDGQDKPVNVATPEQVEALTKKQFGSKPAAQKAIDDLDAKDKFEVVKTKNKWSVKPVQEATQSEVVRGEQINDEWTSFSSESGTLGISRSQMPQIKAESRGAMVNYLKSEGIESEKQTAIVSSLKPSQAEFSLEKVKSAIEFTGGDRSILVSNDGYVIDGHHQWLSKIPNDEINIIRIDAPAEQLIETLRNMPSSEVDLGAEQIQQDQSQPKPDQDSSGMAQQEQFQQSELPEHVRPVSNIEKASTPTGDNVDVQYAVIDADKLITSNLETGKVNPDYPKELQPRDRSRAASIDQVNKIANTLNPRLVAQSATTSDGAPIISPDGVVESGNGRVLGIKQAYKKGNEPSKAYKAYLEEQGYDISGMSNPVLVRVRRTEMDTEQRVKFTRDSNERTTLSMSATEQAQVDADSIMRIIDDFEGGDVTSVANNQFVRKFMASIPESSRADLMDNNGQLSQTGARRIQAGLMQAAYGNPDIIQQMFESSDNDIASIGGALLDAAGYWAKMRSASNDNVIADGVDITDQLMAAVALIRQARLQNKKIAEMVNQDDIFSGEIDPITKDFVRLMYRGDNYTQTRSRQKVAGGLVGYASAALKTQAGESIFGDVVTADQLLEQQNAKIERIEEPPKTGSDLFTGAGLTPFGTEKGGRVGQGQEPSTVRKPAEQPTTTEDTQEQEEVAPVEDFGEKLGGARKDMPQVKSLDKDLEVADIVKLPLSKIWDKKEIDKIEDQEVAAFMHTLRSEIPAKPRKPYLVKRWAENVKMLRDLGRSYLESKGRILDKINEPKFIQIKNTVYAKTQLLSGIPRDEWGRIGSVEAIPDAVGGSKVIVRIDGNKEIFDYEDDVLDAVDLVMEKMGQAKGVAKQGQPYNKLFTVRIDSRTNVAFIHRSSDPDRTRLMEFDQGEPKSRGRQAWDYAKNNVDALLAKWEEVKAEKNVKKTDIRSQENRPRIGEDVRNGKDATPEMFQSQFSFRGVEFGNWVKQGKGTRDRQRLLNDVFDALVDLAALLDIPTKSLSLNGKLGLGIGSRGRGGMAMAHFERDAFVINLTKTKGAGTLAHEWFHALDNYFARNRDGYSHESDIAFITNKPEPMMVLKTSGNERITASALTKSELERRSERHGGIYRLDRWQVDPNHPAGVRKEVEAAFAELVNVLKDSPMYKRASTIDAGKSNGYWSSTIEMAARAFEAYIIAKMEKSGAVNDFLANVVPVELFPRAEERYPYPTKEEMQPIVDAFDNLFNKIEVVDPEGAATLNEPTNYYGKDWKRNSDPKEWSKEDASNYYEDAIKLDADKVVLWAANDQFNTLSPSERALTLRVASQIDDVISVDPSAVPASIVKPVKAIANRAARYFKMSDFDTDALVNFEMFVQHIQEQAKFAAQHTQLTDLFDGEPSKRDIVKGAENAIKELSEEITEAKTIKGNPLAVFKGVYEAQVKQGMYEYLIDELKNNSIDAARDLVAIRYPALSDEAISQEVKQGLTNNSVYEAQTSYGYDQQLAFKAWFGDSKVVDENGEPLVVYRGMDADAESMRPNEKGLIWVTPDANYASDPHYGGKMGGVVYPLFVKAENLFDTKIESHAELLRSKKNTLFREAANGNWRALSDPSVIKVIKDGGFDGLKAIEPEGQESIAVFEPSQIKSAIGNRGTFDPQDPSIVNDQEAWHGSPHYWTKPSLQRIGSGEGDQVFGWGLYFASDKEVAKWYQKSVGYKDVVSQFLSELPEDIDIEETLEVMGEGVFSPKMQRLLEALNADDWLGFEYPAQAITAVFRNPEGFEISQELMDAINNYGNLYELDIPENDELLNFNARFSSQPQKVKDALKPFVEQKYQAIVDGIQAEIDALVDEAGKSPTDQQKLRMRSLATKKEIYTNPTGESIYRRISEELGGDREASLHLNGMGIKGLRYKDATSRSKSDDDSNYNFVIWDQDAITVKTINGEMVPVNEPKPFSEMDANQLDQAIGQYKQLSFGLADLPKISKDSEKESRKFVSRLQRIKDSIVANKVSADFKDGGATNLIGKQVNNSRDLALLAQVYRNPAFESMRYFFVRDGKVVGQYGVTSRMAGASKITPNNMQFEEFVSYMNNMMDELGANGYYMLHNHPTGRPEPSRADISVTLALHENVKGLLGHIIVNDGEYAVIDRFGSYTYGEVPKELVTYDLSKAKIPHPVLKKDINSPQEFAAVATEVYRPDSVAVVGTDPSGKVSGVAHLDRNEVGEFDELTTINFITTFTRQTGSSRVFIANIPHDLRHDMNKLAQAGFIMDYITDKGGVSYVTPSSMPTRKGVELVEEPNSEYFRKRAKPIVAFGKPEQSLFDSSIRIFADKFRMLKLLQREIINKGGQVPEDADVYLSEELFYGRAENDMDVFQETYIEPMTKLMGKYNITQMELDTFLYAKHAPERNKAIAEKRDDMPDGGSGMSTAEANRIILEIEKAGKLEQYNHVAKYIYDMLQTNRELIRKHGLEDDETIYAWEEAYNWYVPLKGLSVDEPEYAAMGTGQGFNIFGRESRSALGRRSRALSPSSYAIADATKLIIRAQKNEVGNALLNLVEANPNPKYWQVFTDEKPDMKMGEVTRKDPKTGKRVKKVELVKVPMAMVSRNYFTTKRDGKVYYIKLHDPRIEHAMKNLGPQANNFVIRSLAAYTRYLSMVNTSLNPEFMITNFARDIQTALFNIMAEETREDGKLKGEKIAAQAVKNVNTAMRTFYRNARGKTPKNKEWDQYLKEFLEDGAKTGYFDMKDLPQIEKSISRMVAIASGSMKGTMLQSTQAAAKFIEDLNSAVENAIRLSTYVAARKAGISRKGSASVAKNLTVNFNRKGEIGSTMTALYMFFNASIQGNVNFARAIVTLRPKEKAQIPVYGRLNAAQKIAGGMMIFGFILSALGRAFGGKDDDGVDWWDKIPQYEKERNLIIMESMWGGEAGKYRKVMLPYGYNVFPNIGYSLESVIAGSKTPLEAGGDLAVTALGSFSPIGFAESDDLDKFLLKNASPTIIRPIVDIGINENYMGNTIYNVQPPYGVPEPQSSMGRRNTPEAYKQIAMFLNDLTGGDNKITGWIDIAPESLEYLVGYMTGGAGNFAFNKVPQNIMAIVNQKELPPQRIIFYGKVAGEVLPYADISKFYDRLDKTRQYKNQANELRGEERKKFLDDYGHIVFLSGMAEQTSVQLRRLRKQRDNIEQNSVITEDEREKRLEQVEKRMKAAVDQFNKLYNEKVEKQT